MNNLGMMRKFVFVFIEPTKKILISDHALKNLCKAIGLMRENICDNLFVQIDNMRNNELQIRAHDEVVRIFSENMSQALINRSLVSYSSTVPYPERFLRHIAIFPEKDIHLRIFSSIKRHELIAREIQMVHDEFCRKNGSSSLPNIHFAQY